MTNYNNATPEDNARLADILNSGNGNEIYNKVLKFSFNGNKHNILTYIKGRAYKTFKNNPCFVATSSDEKDVQQSVLELLLRAIKNTEGKFDPNKGSIEAWLHTSVDKAVSVLLRDTYRLQRRGLGEAKDGEEQSYPIFLSLDHHEASAEEGAQGEVSAGDVHRYLSYSEYREKEATSFSEKELSLATKLERIRKLGNKLNGKETEVLTILAKTGSFEKTAAQLKMTQAALRKSLARLHGRLEQGNKVRTYH